MVTGLCSVAPAQGALFIGSNLGSNANSNNCGATDCTTTNLALGGDLAPGGLTSPINGVVTSWRFKSGSNGNTVALRVLRPVAGVTFTGIASSGAVTSAAGINGPFLTSLAIKAGDHVGLNRSNGAIVLSTDVGATQLFWTMPQLGDGESRAGTTAMNQEVLVQAGVEFDIDCDAQGDESQDPIVRQGCLVKVLSGAASKGTLNLQVQCPLVTQACDSNTVTLATSTPVKLGKSKAAAAAKKKKKKKKPKAAVIPIGTVTTSVPAGQTLTVPLTLTGNANALFRQRTSVGVSATITGSGKTLVEQFTATSSNPKPKKKKKKKKK
jgi:hypothetical protein